MDCWSILTQLHFPGINGETNSKEIDAAKRIKQNLQKLKQLVELTPQQLTDSLVKNLKLNDFKWEATDVTENTCNEYLYSIYLIYLLRKVCEKIDLESVNKEDLIAEKNRTLIIAGVEEILEYGIKCNLHSDFAQKKDGLFCGKFSSSKVNFNRTILLVWSFTPLVFIPSVYTSHTLKDVTLNYMAALYSLLFAAETKEHHLSEEDIYYVKNKMLNIWTKISKIWYFRNLMIFYAILPEEKKKIIHKDMLFKLWSSGGFKAFLFAMVDSKENDKTSLPQVVSKLVSQPSFPEKAQQSLVKQILQFITSCVNNNELLSNLGVGLLSLRELILNKSANKEMVRVWLQQKFKNLLEIEEESLTIMEWNEFADLINLMFQMFCTSTIECLPSELLLPYLPLLIDCHMHLRLCGKQDQAYKHISALIINVINNCQQNDLSIVMRNLALKTHPPNWFNLHPKITVEENPLNAMELRLIHNHSHVANILATSNLVELIVVLNESTFSLLAFHVFMCLFNLLLLQNINVNYNNKVKSELSNSNLLMTDEELEENLFKKQMHESELIMDIVKCLELLVQQKGVQNVIVENVSDVLKVLGEILVKFADRPNQIVNETMLMVLVELICEILQMSSSSGLEIDSKTLMKPLKTLKAEILDEQLKFKITYLEKLIRGEVNSNSSNSSEAKIAEARNLIETGQPYQQVQGIEQLMSMIKAKDMFALSSVHVITTLALKTLKSTESYTFLNCVRLFVSLVNVSEKEVLNILVDEYLNEITGCDYRLVVGETLLKVCQQLGPLCFKYKGLLFNCFLSGCRSPLDEFRFSSFSNLGQMCRLLSYQVHNFIQELLHLVDCELSTGKYLPAKRAAVIVLCDLLEGINNLLDYEDMLLPIYRLLKHLATSYNIDEKMQMHAVKGLECMSEKCKHLLFKSSQMPLEKKIEIKSINSKPHPKALKDHILYMN